MTTPAFSPGSLRYWHPVRLSRELKEKPLGIQLCGRRIVLFRTPQGVGALDDVCPHRQVPLSLGRVESGRLVCRYHGWRFDPGGTFECPSDPSVCGTASGYEVVELHGAIWIKARGARVAPPELAQAGARNSIQLRMRFQAPLELVADNLAEMEHTGEIHWFFGYDADRLREVTVETTVSEASVRVRVEGPQRRLPKLIGWLKQLIGSAADDWFIDDLCFQFDPVRSTAESYWVDPITRHRRPVVLHSTVYLVPADEHTTDIIGFYSYELENALLARLSRGVAATLLRLELYLDRRITELAAQAPMQLERMQLDRFDAPLHDIRDGIARYRTVTSAAAPSSSGEVWS